MSWIQNTIHQSVSLLRVTRNGKSEFSTGFFYAHINEEDLKVVGWQKLDKTFFVTAKHSLYLDEKLCDKLYITARSYVNNQMIPFEIILDQKEILQNGIVHINADVDIVLIEIDLVKKIISGETTNKSQIAASFFTRGMLPKYNEVFEVETTSDVIAIGFPYGHYDKYNVFPLCKSGIIASGWNLKFDDDPKFKIDVQLYPISSGSPVISKPMNYTVKNGQMYFNKDPDFMLLGIYTGEYQPIIEEDMEMEFVDSSKEIVKVKRCSSIGFGTVFYSYLIDEIILNSMKIESEI